jgi:hypothetical protein
MKLLVNMAENGLLRMQAAGSGAGACSSWPVRRCGDTVTAGGGLFPIIF